MKSVHVNTLSQDFFVGAALLWKFFILQIIRIFLTSAGVMQFSAIKEAFYRIKRVLVHLLASAK